jgi:(p)ppGpp synthase/HD superfamily hydrolase
MANDHWSQDLYLKAYRFAALAHRGQVVPGTDISYIMHLSIVSMEMIAALRIETGRDENLAVQCALLHDVIEDTKVTSQQVATEFGDAVAAGVMALTKDQTLDKSLQMEDSLRRIKRQPPEIWMVKLADRITNLQRPPAHWTKEKIAKYQIEAIEILHALGEASEYLGSRLRQKISEYDSYLSPDTSR